MLAALFSGGKDSTYSVFKSIELGHSVVCLITAIPYSEESMLLHYPNIRWTKLQAESMKIPQKIVGVEADSVQTEISKLKDTLQTVKDEFHIDGIVHGGIQSVFQKKHFEDICTAMDLATVSPAWNKDQNQYMHELIDLHFRFIITGVSSAGLDDSWLGVELNDTNISAIERLSKKHGFNLNFEGGEAETFVTNCPLFSHRVKIVKGKTVWDGYRGRFEIEDAELKM